MYLLLMQIFVCLLCLRLSSAHVRSARKRGIKRRQIIQPKSSASINIGHNLTFVEPDYLAKKYAGHEGNFSCSTIDSCMQVHMDNAKQSILFRKRFEYVATRSKTIKPKLMRKFVSFMHIPKCAGTFLTKVLKKYSEDSNNDFSFRETGHAPFIAIQNMFPEDILLSLVRNPIDQALSFYNYVNGGSWGTWNTLDPRVASSPLWRSTIHIKPKFWGKLKKLREILFYNFVFFFTNKITDIEFYMDNGVYQHLPFDGILRRISSSGASLKTNPLFATTYDEESEYTRYLKTMNIPEEFQCTAHINAVVSAVKHFSVLGVVENINQFQISLNKMLGTSMNLTSTDAHNYKSVKILSMKMRATIERNIKELLFCETVLYNTIALVADQDDSFSFRSKLLPILV